MKRTIKIFARIGIGNQIAFIPALKLLERNGYQLYTNSKILLDLVPELFQEKYSGNKKYDYGIVLYSQGLPVTFQARRQCRKVIGFPCSFKLSGHRPVPLLSTLFYTKSMKFNKNKSEIINNVNLLSWLGIKEKDIDFSLNIPRKTQKGVIGISAGSGGNPQKRWHKWPQLLDQLRDREIRLFGTEIDLNKQIKSKTKNKNVKIIKTDTIREAALEIGKCEIFVSNDNGLMHLADIMKVPVIALFGMTNKIRNGPWNQAKVVSLDLPCAPCYQNGYINCIYKKDKYKCMQIPVDIVLQVINEMEKINE
ncbi:MAG: glycosyltransferase family 9 protein [bacterium]